MQSAARADRNNRRAPRRKADIEVGIRKQGEHRVATRLIDLSRFGFRVTADGLAVDSIVWLKLPEAEPLMARVVWSDSKASGCVFTAMLDGDLFRETLRREPMEATLIAGPWEKAAHRD